MKPAELNQHLGSLTALVVVPWITEQKCVPEGDSSNTAFLNCKIKTRCVLIAEVCWRMVLEQVLHVLFYNVVDIKQLGNAFLQWGLECCVLQ